jgi:hypothetical protein
VSLPGEDEEGLGAGVGEFGGVGSVWVGLGVVGGVAGGGEEGSVGEVLGGVGVAGGGLVGRWVGAVP